MITTTKTYFLILFTFVTSFSIRQISNLPDSMFLKWGKSHIGPDMCSKYEYFNCLQGYAVRNDTKESFLFFSRTVVSLSPSDGVVQGLKLCFNEKMLKDVVYNSYMLSNYPSGSNSCTLISKVWKNVKVIVDMELVSNEMCRNAGELFSNT